MLHLGSCTLVNIISTYKRILFLYILCQVSLQRWNGFHFSHFCGGSIVASEWVVTAAHCCEGRRPIGIKVVAGGVSLQQDEGVEQTRFARLVIIHERYGQPVPEENDICMIKLRNPFVLTENVNEVILPRRWEEVPSGSMVTVTGWGRVRDDDSPLSDILEKVSVPVVSDRKCKKEYEFVTEIARSMLCAGFDDGGKDSCQEIQEDRW